MKPLPRPTQWKTSKCIKELTEKYPITNADDIMFITDEITQYIDALCEAEVAKKNGLSARNREDNSSLAAWVGNEPYLCLHVCFFPFFVH